MSSYNQNNKLPINTELKTRKEFSDREVGFSHPDLPGFMRLSDNGDIEIFTAPGVGIIISSKSRSISFFGDSVNFFTKDDGLRWNTYNFNISAYDYSQPTLVKISKKNINQAQEGVYHYLDLVNKIDKEEQSKPVTITGSFNLGNLDNQERQDLISKEDYSDLSFEDIALLEVYSTDYPKSHIDLIVKFLREGLTFSQAHQKALRDQNDSERLSSLD